MRVIHVLRKCDPAAWGGTEMAMHRMFDGLRRSGVNPIIYCPRIPETAQADPLRQSGFQVERFKAFVPVLGIPEERRRQLISVGGNLMSFDLISSLLKERDAKIIHAHTLGRIGGIALTVAKQHRVPFVVTIHGGALDLPDKVKQSFNTPTDSGWEWGKFFGLIFQSHRLFVDASAIITCNQTEASLLRERHPDKRIVVQSHAVEMAPYAEDHRAAARMAFPKIAGREILLSLGRVDPVKNQSWLVEQVGEIVQQHPNALLVFAGACTDAGYGERLEQRIQELGLSERVILTGGLPPNDPRLIGLLQQASVLLLPSLSETFGLVILEAWAAGIPVIASATSGAKALIQHGHNGWLYDLDQPAAFHEALSLTLRRPHLAREMGSRGKEKVRENFTIEKMSAQMKQLYEDVISENHALRHPQRR